MSTVLLVTSVALLSMCLPEGGNHLVFSVTTDLQRVLLGRPGEPLRDAKAYVLVNGVAVVSENGMIDAKALDLAAIAQQLAPYADRERGVVYFNVCYRRPSPDRREEFLLWALYGFAVHRGFRDAKVGNSYMTESFDWEKHIARVNETSAGDPDGDEPPIGNDLVRVYPVRTILSRYLTPHADCVVDVLHPFGKDGLARETLEAIEKFVPKTQVKRKRVIHVRIWSQAEGRQAADDFMSKRDSTAFAESLGYELSTVEHTPR
jgi:hypothetical protein